MLCGVVVLWCGRGWSWVCREWSWVVVWPWVGSLYDASKKTAFGDSRSVGLCFVMQGASVESDERARIAATDAEIEALR